jgi:hypothetical protein
MGFSPPNPLAILATYSALAAIPEWCRDILDMAGVSYPETHTRLIETSKSVAQACVSKTSVACICPRLTRSVTSRCRLLHPAEALHLQGLCVDSAVLTNFSSSCIADLAGNSFHAGNALMALLAQLTVCAVGARRRMSTLLAAPACAVDADAEDDGLSDLDLDNLF